MDDCGRCEGDEIPTYEIEARIQREDIQNSGEDIWIEEEEKNTLAEILKKYYKK